MSKEKKVSKVEVKEVSKIKLNVNYVDFIVKVIKEKMEEMNKEELREVYLKSVNVKSYRNIKRVGNRIIREGLKDLLISEVEKRGVKYEDFIKCNENIIIKIGEKGLSNNYIEIWKYWYMIMI